MTGELTELLVAGGQRLLVHGAPQEVELKILSAARGSILEFVTLTEAESGASVAVNPEHIVAVRGGRRP